jgi:hypothetical protein
MDPDERRKQEELGRLSLRVPDFDRVPTWVRTFYWMPIIGSFARAWIERHDAYRPAEPPAGPDGWTGDDPDAGTREPRRPRPFAGAGAVQLEVPEDDVLDPSDDPRPVFFDEAASPTSAA